MTSPVLLDERARLVKRGIQLEYATILYNSLEGLIAIVSGTLAGSVALVGFGVDSLIEVTSGISLIWRLRSDSDPKARARAELISLRIVGCCFIALAIYVTVDALNSLVNAEGPGKSIPGILLAAVSVIVMPLLARAKRNVAAQIESAALMADAKQTQLCTYLSIIVLLGLVSNALVGWWWADPVAALLLVPIIVVEGVRALRGKACCSTC